MFRSLLASGLHRVLEFDRAHLGLPLSRLALYSRRETAEWTRAWSFRKGFVKLGHIIFAGESNRVAVADFVLIASFDRSETGMSLSKGDFHCGVKG
jgi:hypothetical protein